MYSSRILSFVFFLIMCLLAGCGSGGGGGGSGGSNPSTPPTIVYLGTVAFNPATSAGIDRHTMGFSLATWEFGAVSSTGSTPEPTPLDADQTFTLSQVVISGVAVPCLRVQLVDPGDPSAGLYEWWAVATDGGLYRLTRGQHDYLPGADDGVRNDDGAAPILLSQARLIIPATMAVGTSWSSGSTAAMSLNNSSMGHMATRTVEVVGVMSPNGFPGCTRVRADCPHYSATWYEWWMPERGLVEVVDFYAPTLEWTYDIRTDFTTSG